MKIEYGTHRVQSARLFLQSSNWDSPIPSHAGERVPLPSVPGVGVHSLAGEGVVGTEDAAIRCML
jgi:hypothetical protein